eukprot:Filipodium_phascolosomae@DN7391_c0_g1_i1.p1
MTEIVDGPASLFSNAKSAPTGLLKYHSLTKITETEEATLSESEKRRRFLTMALHFKLCPEFRNKASKLLVTDLYREAMACNVRMNDWKDWLHTRLRSLPTVTEEPSGGQPRKPIGQA